MVVTKSVDNRWIRRYKVFFVVGMVILAFQLYLVLKFLALNAESTNNQDWVPYKSHNLDNTDVENSVDSARKPKDGFVIDDEDLNNIHHHVKTGPSKSNPVVVNKPSNKNHTYLRIEELDFVPQCEITTKETISAIHRAKTQRCKQIISNTMCLIQKGSLYPTNLPNYCPGGQFTKAKSLGCFKDEKKFRLLSGYFANYGQNNSPDYCIRMCLQSGFQYAGVEYSSECFCGNDEPASTAKLPDSSCNMKCPLNKHLTCGGYFTIEVYETGIIKFTPQEVETSTQVNTKSVKIVFLLTLNGRAIRQVKRLIKILYHKNHYFYIHVDVRQDYLFRELLKIESQFPNIRLTRRRFSTIWGGASLLEMLLSSMKELLHSSWDWDFVINLSESDYPVKTLDRLVEFLSANSNKNFVKSHGREVQRFIQKQGLDKTFVECDAHMWRIGDRQLPWGIQVDGGSDWVALSRPFVTYVAKENIDNLVKGLLVIFKHTLLPAESFFHTVLRNSKFCNTYVDNNLHVTNWKRKLGCKCQYKHIVDWCGCSPNDFRPEDWLRVQNTEPRQIFFARKFEPIINQAIILQVEQWLYGLDINRNIPNINSYWQNIYHYQDLTPIVSDALITAAESAVRIKSKILSTVSCNIIPLKVLEITSFHLKDAYERTLILYEANVTELGLVKLELNFKPKNELLLLKSTTLSRRLQSLVVSTDYDQKEQMSRNFAQIIGPYSEPVLIYQFTSSLDTSAKSENVSFLWIDSTGHLIEVSEASIDESFIIASCKLNAKVPLIPGHWIVKLVHKNVAIAETKFLIFPLEYFSGNIVQQNQVNFINSGSFSFKEFDSNFNNFLSSNYDREILESKATANSKRFGTDLKEWIDVLFNKFFIIGKMCTVKNISQICNYKLPRCNLTNWSSFSPDPKSSLQYMNNTVS